jgi:phage shock protein C
MTMKRTFNLDKGNAMLLGVCSGIAKYTNVDATFIRIGLVVVTIFGGFPWTLIAYGAAAWLAKPGGYRREEPGPIARASSDEVRARMTDIDRRMAEVETYVTSSNTSLAREIDSLR